MGNLFAIFKMSLRTENTSSELTEGRCHTASPEQLLCCHKMLKKIIDFAVINFFSLLCDSRVFVLSFQQCVKL